MKLKKINRDFYIGITNAVIANDISDYIIKDDESLSWWIIFVFSVIILAFVYLKLTEEK